MAAIPGTIEPDKQPPMTLPLRHFAVGLGLLLVGAFVGIGVAVQLVPGLASLAHVHLLFVGWICITILGAMTQFVPVWSGVPLHSRRLASVQLPFVGIGVLGMSLGLVLDALTWLILFAGLMFVGFWLFVYNLGRTMVAIDSYDVTEAHFLLSLGFFAMLTVIGFLLAVDFTWPVFDTFGVTRPDVVATHATVAVFGAVLTTVYGALYQLATMFTQTDLHGIDTYLQSFESWGHPIGVVLLAVGRLLDAVVIAQFGAVLVVGAALAVSAMLARRLYEMQVAWTPMHFRYAVAVPGLAGWGLLTFPAWLRAPTAAPHVLGAPGAVHLFVLGAIGFVVFGTLYHIVPFIIWVHRYSDLLGMEDVPMIDDLYNESLALVDASLLVSGTLLLAVSEWFQLSTAWQALGGGLVGLGIAVFSANLLLVILTHSPQSLGHLLLGSLDPRSEPATDGDC